MERQNVTISVPKHVLQEAKHLAVERGTSLSKFLSDYLEILVKTQARKRKSAQRIKRRLGRGLPLGTMGKCTWTRDSLHER
jgi:hypothetical protein